MRLPIAVIGILSKQYQLDIIKWCSIKGMKDQRPWRINGFSQSLFRFQEGNDLVEIVFFEFIFQYVLPGWFDLNVHRHAKYTQRRKRNKKDAKKKSPLCVDLILSVFAISTLRRY